MHAQKLEILSTILRLRSGQESETNSKCECSNDQNRDRGGRGFRIGYLAEKRILEKKGGVVDQRNHNESIRQAQDRLAGVFNRPTVHRFP